MEESIPVEEIVNEQTGKTKVPIMSPDKKNVFATFTKKIILCVIFLGNTWNGRINSS